MKIRNTVKAFVGSLLVLAVCAGCSIRSSEDLYALPKQSDAYYDLQYAIDRVMNQDTVFAGPLTGSNQQTVQLADLDADGQEEAIVFTKSAGSCPLKAYIFDQNGSSYENIGVIEGDGSSFDSVEYAQLDGEPGLEIVVGRQISDQVVQAMGVYAIRDGHVVELLTANYSEYVLADLDGDDRKDLVIIRMDSEARTGIAELYRCKGGVLERDQEANLSAGATQVKRIVSGYVAQGVPAVFVASTYETGTIITDIFAFSGNRFLNVALLGESSLNAGTVRSYHVYATDIDSDGVIELPQPVVLPSAQAGDETYWTIDWYALTPEVGRNIKLTTFHNYSGGWYLELPQHWRDHLTVSRDHTVSGVTGYTFSKWNGYDRPSEEIVTVYAFTGDDRLTLAQSDGRFLLAEKGDTAYSAVFGACDWAAQMTEEELSAMFRFVYLDWNSGER